MGSATIPLCVFILYIAVCIRMLLHILLGKVAFSDLLDLSRLPCVYPNILRYDRNSFSTSNPASAISSLHFIYFLPFEPFINISNRCVAVFAAPFSNILTFLDDILFYSQQFHHIFFKVVDIPNLYIIFSPKCVRNSRQL